MTQLLARAGESSRLDAPGPMTALFDRLPERAPEAAAFVRRAFWPAVAGAALINVSFVVLAVLFFPRW